MERKWLRGMLLGISLALLLAGGVALAQMTLTVDQDCFECWPSVTAGPDAEHTVVVTLDDYDIEADLCEQLWMNGELYWNPSCLDAEVLVEPPCRDEFWVDCGRLGFHIHESCYVEDGIAPEWREDAGATQVVEYGDWVLRAWQPGGPVQEVAFTFAEVCEAEFVPEPGTIALLGSGLAGLAGYAALRWRSRQ